MYEFKLPDLGEGIHEGEILRWHVQPGQKIELDQLLVEVETDKAAVSIPSPVAGVVVSLGGKEGEIVFVGSVLLIIDSGEQPRAGGAAPAADPPAVPPRQQPAATPAAIPSRSTALPGTPKPIAAPATRRLARELGVDLALVIPTGPAGRVTSEDLHGYLAQDQQAGVTEQPPEHDELRTTDEWQSPLTEVAAHAASTIPFLDLEPLPDFSQWGPVELEQLRSIRRKVAHKMVTSKVLVPHVAHMDEADVTELERFRKHEQTRRGDQPGGHLTLLAFVIKAVTAGLRATPSFNASLEPFAEHIIYKKFYNIGIAVDTGRGLVVPVIKETDRKSILRISSDIEQLVARAREGRLEPDQMRGGTFTITNVGPLGGTALIPAINYPEVAILGMGRVQEKPVVRHGEIVVRKILPLTLAFDHRIADGADAARFVTEMVRQLSDPNLLLLET